MATSRAGFVFGRNATLFLYRLLQLRRHIEIADHFAEMNVLLPEKFFRLLRVAILNIELQLCPGSRELGFIHRFTKCLVELVDDGLGRSFRRPPNRAVTAAELPCIGTCVQRMLFFRR
jgi:hypothetical protein